MCCRSGSISGPVAETHDLLVDSATSINTQAIPPDPPLPRRRRRSAGRPDPDRALAHGRPRPVQAATRLAARRVGSRVGTTAGLPPPRWRWTAIQASPRSRASERRRCTVSSCSLPTWATTLRPSRASSGSRTGRGSARATTGGSRSPSRPTTVRVRSTARSSRSHVMGSTSSSSRRVDSADALALPLRRRPQRPSARHDRLRDARRGQAPGAALHRLRLYPA